MKFKKRLIENKIKELDMNLPEESESVVSELIVTFEMLRKGEYLIDTPPLLDDNTLVVMVNRGDHYIVPNDCTFLFPEDRLFIISDNEKELKQICEKLGVENYIFDFPIAIAHNLFC